MTDGDVAGSRRPDGLCDGCGVVLVDPVTHVPNGSGLFITRIHGLERVELTGTSRDDEVIVTSFPSCCAKPECLARVISDPRWHRVDWKAKIAATRERMRESEERIAESAAKYESHRLATEQAWAATDAAWSHLCGLLGREVTIVTYGDHTSQIRDFEDILLASVLRGRDAEIRAAVYSYVDAERALQAFVNKPVGAAP